MHKEPLLPNQEIISGSKRKKKSAKKSKHKHKYTYYKEYVGEENGIDIIVKEGKLHSMYVSSWNIYHLCSICGKDSGNIFLFLSQDKMDDAIKNGIDITRYKKGEKYD